MPSKPIHFSQYGQDALVGDVLFRGRPGIFVDVGARDGVQISNTVYLERELGWTGIAFEPHPDLFKRLAASRTCRCVNVAVSDEERNSLDFVKFLEEPFGNSGLLESFPGPERLANIKHEIISIPTAPLRTLLQGFDRVDYLDIDVEGHEMSVLRGIDFSSVEIRIIGVEAGEGSRKAGEVDVFLGQHGFRPFMQVKSDRFYCFGDALPSSAKLVKLD